MTVKSVGGYGLYPYDWPIRRAGVDGWDVGVVGLGELGARLGDIGLRPLHARIAAQRQIDRRCKRELRLGRVREAEKQTAERQGDRQTPKTARLANGRASGELEEARSCDL